MQAVSLLEAVAALEDPRADRGVRHPCTAIVALALQGMTTQIREVEVPKRFTRTLG